MATIKSYSDLQQSKKLAEILPLESADMLFQLGEDMKADSIRVPLTKKHWEQMMPAINPCWSLANLLGVLPKRIELEGVAYELSIYLNGLYYWNVNNGNLLLEVKGEDNLVDACVEMIMRLKEHKML